jgi:hypothetical protein
MNVGNRHLADGRQSSTRPNVRHHLGNRNCAFVYKVGRDQPLPARAQDTHAL